MNKYMQGLATRVARAHLGVEREGLRRCTSAAAAPSAGRLSKLKTALKQGPDLTKFVHQQKLGNDRDASVVRTTDGAVKRAYIETYGCQMNVADTEVVIAILNQNGWTTTHSAEDANLVLLNTCAIRENAENKIWQRLNYFRNCKRKMSKTDRPVVGVLGCMAERLKVKLLETDKMVDLVVGPDAYRRLPDLIEAVRGSDHQQAMDVQLSIDETYGDISPVRYNSNGTTAFVSIMRGCNNMCAFCVVPFTRGRERSREVDSILKEIEDLKASGFGEVTVLGQNVNSYHDRATESMYGESSGQYAAAKGFKNMYQLRDGAGVRFTELLDILSAAYPEMRFRFTSPHPKDFPDDLLHLMADRPNICSQIHMPAQSGSTRMLERMRRGYSRESYSELVRRIREVIPGVALSSDFISGFCGETQEDHDATIDLLREVQYDQAFMFAYSKRDRTHAAYKYEDDVPEDVKLQRLQEVIDTFRAHAEAQSQKLVGSRQLVLVEGRSKRSTAESPQWAGRVDSNRRCLVDDAPLPSSEEGFTDTIAPGDFVEVEVTSAGVTTLMARPIRKSSIADFAASQQ